MLKNEKPKIVENLKKLIEEHSVIGVLDMHNLPAKQLQKIRDSLRATTIIIMNKKSMIKRAISESKKDIKKLEETLVNEPALILSNENPFRLFRTIKSNRSSASAKAGNIAMNDIVIKKGKTGIPPGPAISSLQKIGLKTSVQEGKISVIYDKVAVKAGEIITSDMVNAFNLLKMEPMEIGLNLVAVWENGVVYPKDVLDIDVNAYTNKVNLAITCMINLSLNSGYLVPLTAELAIQKAFMEAKSLALEANIIDKSIIGELLMKAVIEAKGLKTLLPEKEAVSESK
ncbi:MAG: 50S ribosomal protein L10 [Candidatus Aenigmarchaeota archaeon]|nr:50S ribosomal protein L10 [Candidatus Aenigmarchaeota archaeon]